MSTYADPPKTLTRALRVGQAAPQRPPEPERSARGPRISRAQWGALFAKWQNVAINTAGIQVYNELIEERVINTYGQFSAYERDLRDRSVELLDQKILDDHGPAVFLGEIHALLADPRVRSYLTDLQAALAEASPQQPVRLWDFTLARAGSEREATRWIATLLQDYTPEVLQGLGFIRMVDDARGKPILADTLQAVADGMHAGTLSPFPPGVEAGSDIFYHYYVPRYLAQRLVDEGVPRNLAFLIVGTFNLEYELLAPELLDQRHDAVLQDVTAVFGESTGISRQQLDERVRALREAGAVTPEFIHADLDLDADLKLSPAQLEAFMNALGEKYDVPAEVRNTVAGLDNKTLHRMTQMVTGAQLANFLEEKTIRGMIEVVLKPGYQVFKHGVDRPVPLSRPNIADAYLGFAGAASVLPSKRCPFPEQALVVGLLRLGPKKFMGKLYERIGPTSGDQLAQQLRPTVDEAPRAAVSAIAALFSQDAGQGRAAVEQLLAGQDNPRRLARQLLSELAANEPDAPAELEGLLRQAALVGLEPPVERDPVLDELIALVGRQGAQVEVGIVDQAFNSLTPEQRRSANRPRHGIDFIDNDDDPYPEYGGGIDAVASRIGWPRPVGDWGVQHGTPVMKIATRGSDALVPIPIKSGILGVVRALRHAHDSGATVVNISQEMVAASAEDLDVFRAALRAYPDLLVVMAAGNRGKAVGFREHDLAAIDEPNFVKVGAATDDGRLYEESSFHAQHVQFIARGGTRDGELYEDRYVSRALNAVYGTVNGDREATSHAAPVVTNVAAKVRLLAPHLTAEQVVDVLAASSDTTDSLVSSARYGVIDPTLALATAAALALQESGEEPDVAVDRAAKALELRPIVRARLARNLTTL